VKDSEDRLVRGYVENVCKKCSGRGLYEVVEGLGKAKFIYNSCGCDKKRLQYDWNLNGIPWYVMLTWDESYEL